MVYHTIGDSHSMYAWNRVRIHNTSVNVHHLGPWLMHRAGRDGIPTEDLGLQDGDTLILSFGEIDCRCHVNKYVNEDTTYRDVIDDLVDRYGKRILEARDRHPGVRICVYNVLPAANNEIAPVNPQYPFLGTNEERKQYTLYMNEKLREFCTEHDFVFIDIYDQCVDKNGLLSLLITDSAKVHLNRIYPLMIWIGKHF